MSHPSPLIIKELCATVNAQIGDSMPDLALLQSLLPDTPIQAPEETSSTNTDARRWLQNGAAHGSLVAADRQTAGRGRLGRSFASADGGLYMSVVIKSDLPAGVLTTLCAVAVRRAVKALTGITADIKWVNDLQVNGKKICGILCEGVWQGDRLLGVIAGIGLNICQREFPEGLRDIAASLYPDGHSPVDPARFCAAIWKEIFSLLPLAPAHMAEYRQACLTLGQRVYWENAAGRREGMARDVDDTGALLIDTAEGPVLLAAGEVSVRPFSD